MTKEELKKQEEEFFKIKDQILEEAKKRGITLRILGSIAFRSHCPEFKYLEYDLGRPLTDIDFAGYSKDVTEIEALFLELGYEENQNIKYLYGTQRRLFFHPHVKIVIDVFLDRLRFCHDINLNGRLTIDYPTIPLVDLLLGKLQIVEINEKDIIDSIVLIREHNIGKNDKETINVRYLSELCSNDWGLWKTVTINLKKIEKCIHQHLQNEKDAIDVVFKINKMLEQINGMGKGLKWKMRNLIGDKVRWYQEVEEVNREQC